MKKKIIFWGIFLLVCIVVMLSFGNHLYATQVKEPMVINKVIIDIEHMSYPNDDINYLEKNYQDVYEGIIEDDTLLRLSGDFPGGAIEDYGFIVIKFDVKNNSYLNQKDIKGYITTPSKNSRMLYCSDSIASEFVDKRTSEMVTPIWMYMYIKDMTATEIVEYIKEQEVKIYFYNYWGESEMNFKLKDIENIEVEVS